jgi:predicted O-methyltransferase YrrM
MSAQLLGARAGPDATLTQDASFARLLDERPKFHVGEPEVRGSIDRSDMALLRLDQQETIRSRVPFSMGIDDDTARLIYERVGPASTTLETGSGISTLIFALRGAEHFAVTPNANESIAIREYANANGIDVSRVRFVNEPSESALPAMETPRLDLVLIDGKHAFPWPILDWFFTADRLKRGGIVILDDTPLWAVQGLARFLSADSRNWRRVARSGKAVAFQKIVERAHDVAWYMQPHADSLRMRLLRTLPPSILRLAKRLRG